MSDATEYGLVMAFDSDDPEFVRGFETGQLFEMARRCPEPFERMIHASNTEMVIRIGETTGRHVSASEIPETDTWLNVEVGPTALPARASSSPPGCSHGTAGTSRSGSGRSLCRCSLACRSLTVGTSLLFGASVSFLVGVIARAYIDGRGHRKNLIEGKR